MPPKEQWTRMSLEDIETTSSDFVIPGKERRAIPIKKPPLDQTDTSQPAAKIPTIPARTTSTPSAVASTVDSKKSQSITSTSPESAPTRTTTHTSAGTPPIQGTQLCHSSLDIFSPNYVPLWLRAVNESRAELRHCVPFPSPSMSSYITSFVGSDFLNMTKLAPIPPPVTIPVYEGDLQPHNYPFYWTRHLQNEFTAQNMRYKSYALYNQQIQPVLGRPGFFVLQVPGLRENAPHIDLGDIVHIRVLLPTPHNIEAHVVYWLQYGRHQGAICPGFTGLLYDPQVWEIDRGRERLVLRIDGFVGSVRCNIVFPLQESKLEPVCRAVQIATNGGTWLRSMLFPNVDDGILQTTLSRGTFDVNWVDDLNWEQKKAVHTILSANYGTMPYLISGPPGTGKTKTLVETALQLLEKPGHILVCAPSDAAADTLALRLSTHLRPNELFRLNGATRTFAEVPDRLMLYTHSSNLSFALPPVENLLSFRIVVTTCRDADLLNCARLTNISLCNLFDGVARVLSPQTPPSPIHWTALLLDEAAQATEPDALIPLTVVAPPENKDFPLFIAAGDQHQLGPKLASKSTLSVSLFQRLFEREAYDDHPLSRKYGVKAVTLKMLPMIRPAFANLVRNYRSHAAILSVPSTLFYHDSLIPERKTSREVIEWSGWPSTNEWPVLFQQNSGDDDYESITAGDGTGTGTLFNISEAELALQLSQSLLDEIDNATKAPLQQKEIMIMSPYRAQVSHLRQVFRQNKLFEVNIGPLEAFQGLESRIVIICTTRTRLGTGQQMPSHHVLIDKARGLGIIDEPQSLNVAMTRAQEGLIVIGNAHCLVSTGDAQWLNFLSFCKRNDCYNAPYDFHWPDMKGLYQQGQLEKALIYYAMGKADAEAQDLASSNPGITTTISTSRFTLKGPRKEMDEEMWQFKELAQLQNSDDIDLMLEHTIYEGSMPSDETKSTTGLDDDYDRNLRQEFYQECSTQ